MKAVVMEVRGGEAAILMMDGTVRVVRGRYEVGQEIDYVVRERPTALQWVAAILVAALLLGGSIGLWVNNNYIAYAEVSLDVSPSPIVYTLNRRNRVLSVRAANEGGAEIVEALGGEGLRFAPIGDAVDRTVAVLEEKGYMSSAEVDYVLASVSADDEHRREALTKQVDDAMTRARESDPTLEYRIEPTDRETARAAEKVGMTPGRYSAWKEHGDADKPEDFAAMPVRDILAPEPDGPEPQAAPGVEPQGNAEARPGSKSPARDAGETQAETPAQQDSAAPPREQSGGAAPTGDNPPVVSVPMEAEAGNAPSENAPDEPKAGSAPSENAPDEPKADSVSSGNAPDEPKADSVPSENAPDGSGKGNAPSEPSRGEHSSPERDPGRSDDRSSGQREGSPGPGGGRP